MATKQHHRISEKEKATTTDEPEGILLLHDKQLNILEISNYNENTIDDDQEMESYCEANLQTVFNRFDKWKELLRMVQIFGHLSDDYLEKIVGYLVKIEFNHGEEAVVEGKSATNFYIVEHGCAVIHQNRLSNGVCSKTARLTRGAYCGAVSLVLNVPNTATVVAEGHLMCAKLNANRFRRLVKPVVDDLKQKAWTYKSFNDLIV